VLFSEDPTSFENSFFPTFVCILFLVIQLYSYMHEKNMPFLFYTDKTIARQ